MLSKKMKWSLYTLFLTLPGLSAGVRAQEKSTDSAQNIAYTKVITERAGKIVATIGISDSSKALKVRDLIAEQYRSLNTIHDGKKNAVKMLKEDKSKPKASLDSAILQLENTAALSLQTLHKSYLKKLSKEVSKKQVEDIKNGMTYGVLPITYRGYGEMLPQLTKKQKKQILNYLTEARELAMDAESSEKKHAWFGKYKGRINNYLSAQGIDMKKASTEWEHRIRNAQAGQ